MIHEQSTILPLPISSAECKARGWHELDIILVTGDAYVDHPSFGVALIGRLLESKGYRVAILSQPRFDSTKDFTQFGKPRLFWGITGGNLDSIVANYTGNGKVRDTDAYSPHGNPWRSKQKTKSNRRRPDRAAMLYTNLAKAAFKDVPVILGGIEASLRRFIHYDYKQVKLRGSLLSDAKADLLVYGMGERAIIEIAERLKENKHISNIPGTCERLSAKGLSERNFLEDHNHVILPSWQQIEKEQRLFLVAEKQIDAQARSYNDSMLLQQQQNVWIIQHPQQSQLTTRELDSLYELPFTREEHPAFINVPAAKMIQHSITSVRGCCGNCSFCAITRHQGAAITSRSQDSLLREATTLSKMKHFKGTITDVGGPTANLFGMTCRINSCKKRDCLYPQVCKNLQLNEPAFLELLKNLSAIVGVQHIFISSGLRLELLRKTPELFLAIIRSHTPGALKIAPEHTETEVLRYMHKESHEQLTQLLTLAKKLGKKLKKKVHFSPYIISSHPGCTSKHTANMAKKLQKLGLQLRQFQDFTPTPGTLATAMYVTGLDQESEKPIYVAKGKKERMQQRKILEKLLLMGEKS